jgi:molybdopterin adenylyltransferase
MRFGIKAEGKMINFGILTISDKGSRGERYDGSGAAIQDRIAIMGSRVVRYDIVPDEVDIIRRRLIEWADAGDVDVILTTGGTGLGPRDVTPEATTPILDKLVPGIAEAMRLETLGKTPTAILSRAVAGVRKKCLIINMPGSPNGVRECLEIIVPAIVHAVEIISGTVTEHSPEAHKK